MKMYFFTSGTAKDAAQIMDITELLSSYVAMLGWKQASALAKVMTNLKDPGLVALARPTRTYLCGSGPDAVDTTDRINLGVLNIPMVNYIDYQATMDEYLSKKRRYDVQLENWDKNNAKGYYLMLQHCPKELEAELWNQDSWNTAEEAIIVIKILILIRDLSFNKTDRKRSIMATVDAKNVFKRDTGVCKGMPYINLRNHKEGIIMIETFCKKFVGGHQTRY